MTRRRVGTVFFILFAIEPVWGDGRPRDSNEEVVVTGARIANPVEQVPYAISTLDRSALDARNAPDLPSALAELPGVHVQQGASASGFSTLSLRGSETNFVTVLVDGVRVNDPNNSHGGGFDFASFSLDDIERVEVVRGAHSAVYGSDSLSGVVHVITRNRPTPGWSGAYEVGDAGRNSVQAGASLPAGSRGQLSLSADHFDQGGTVEGVSLVRDAARMRLVLADGDRWRISGYARRSETEGSGFPETSGGPEYAQSDAKDERKAYETTAALHGEVQLSTHWQASGDLHRFEHDEDFSSPGIAPGALDGVPARTSSASLDRTVAVVQSTWTPSAQWRATVGVDHQIERGESRGTIDFGEFPLATRFELERNSTGGFLESQLSASDRLTLLAGFRHDAAEDADGVWTRRAGAVLELAPKSTWLRVNWGEGFKWPSFFALGDPLTGNPELRPERSSSVDVGVTQSWNDGNAELNAYVFSATYRDLIDFDFESFRSVNRSNVRIRGAELGGHWHVTSALRARGHVTYIDTEQADGEAPLRQRPRWRGGGSATWTSDSQRMELHAAWLAVGQAYDTSIATGDRRLDAYNRLDLNVSWHATDKITLQFALDNVLDERYYEAIGFPASGISPRLKFRVTH